MEYLQPKEARTTEAGKDLEGLFLESVERARMSPFYRKKLDGYHVRHMEDLVMLPLTHNKELRIHSPFDLLATSMERIWHYHESFGTTGPPISAWYTLKDFEKEIEIIEEWVSDFSPGKMVLNRFPLAFPVPAQLVELAARLRGGCIIPAGNVNWNVPYERALDLMKRLKANILTAMPMEVFLLAEVAKLKGIIPGRDYPDFESFCCAGRILTPSMKAIIEELWNVRVRNLYGSTEAGPLATSCIDGFLHLHEDYFIFEVLHPDTYNAVEPEAEGILTVSTLAREAQPMIRYVTEDLVQIQETNCSCGRRGRILKVLGRVGEGYRLHGETVHLYDIEEATLRFAKKIGSTIYFVVGTSSGLIIRIETAHKSPMEFVTNDEMEALKEQLRVPFEFDFVPEGTLLDRVSLTMFPKVFKPKFFCNWLTEQRKVSNILQALIEWPRTDAKTVFRVLQRTIRNALANRRLRKKNRAKA